MFTTPVLEGTAFQLTTLWLPTGHALFSVPQGPPFHIFLYTQPSFICLALKTIEFEIPVLDSKFK
jgi:hypothetical protein